MDQKYPISRKTTNIDQNGLFELTQHSTRMTFEKKYLFSCILKKVWISWPNSQEMKNDAINIEKIVKNSVLTISDLRNPQNSLLQLKQLSNQNFPSVPCLL